MKDRSYMQGSAEAIDMMSDLSDNPGGLGRYWRRQVFGLFTPASSLFDWQSEVMNQMSFGEETRPDVNSVSDAFQAKFEAFLGQLPRKRDLWGNRVTIERFYGPFRDGVIPSRVYSELTTPIDVEMRRLRMGVLDLRKRTTFDIPGGRHPTTVDFSDHPVVFEEYVRLAGQGEFFRGMDVREYLNDMVTEGTPNNRAYERGDRLSKQGVIRGLITSARLEARVRILDGEEYEDIPAYEEFRAYHAAEAKAQLENALREQESGRPGDTLQ